MNAQEGGDTDIWASLGVHKSQVELTPEYILARLVRQEQFILRAEIFAACAKERSTSGGEAGLLLPEELALRAAGDGAGRNLGTLVRRVLRKADRSVVIDVHPLRPVVRRVEHVVLPLVLEGQHLAKQLPKKHVRSKKLVGTGERIHDEGSC